MHVERHVHTPTTKKPILMVCSRTTRPHTPSELPLPALSPLPAGCSPWPNTLSFLPFSQGHLIHHCCWHERGSHFALPIHQESMGFIWCLILKMWFDLLGDRLTHLSYIDHDVPACPLWEKAQKPKLHFQADRGLQACLSLAVTA